MKRIIALLLTISVILGTVAVQAAGSDTPVVPASLKAVSASYSSIKLSWLPVTGTRGYKVSKYNPSSKQYSTLTEISSTSCTVSSLTTGVTYYFKVAAYKKTYGVKTYGAYTSAVSARPVPGIPGWVKASAASPNGCTKVSWQAVSGATGYAIYRSASSTKNFTRLKVTAATSCSFSGTLYYYKVAAYKTANKATVYGSFSRAFSTPEISISGLKSKMSGAKILRAWKITDSGTGTTVRVEKLSYGSPIKTTYNGKSYTIPQICFIAVVNCKPGQIRSICAPQALKKDEGLVNDMAKKAGALVAINNEGYYGHWNPNSRATFLGNGPVVKEGKVVVSRTQDKCYAVYKDGTWLRNKWITKNNVAAEIKNGLSYTQAIEGCEGVIWDGKVQLETPKPFYNQNVLFGGASNGLRDRTFYGQIDANNYLLMVGEFMEMGTMMDILLAYGAKKAFWCNGGNCSYMYLKGVGNVTGTTAPQLAGLDKLNLLEQEWKGNHNLLNGGKGAACPAIDIVYVK